MLKQAEQEVGTGQQQADTSGALPVVLKAKDQRDQQHHGEDGVDNRNDAPRNPFIAEGPQQMRAITGAGIQQATGAETQQRVKIYGFETDALTQQQP